MNYWTSGAEREGSLHTIGNGKMLMCFDGPSITSVQGPPITAPPFFSILPGAKGFLECRYRRWEDSNIWIHKLSFSGEMLQKRHFDEINAAVTFVDYIDPQKCIFIRKCLSYGEMALRIAAPEYVEAFELTGYRIRGQNRTCILFRYRKNAYPLAGYIPYGNVCTLITLTGNALRYDAINCTINIKMGAGEIIITSGTPEECVSGAANAIGVISKQPAGYLPCNSITEASNAYWGSITNTVSASIGDSCEKISEGLRVQSAITDCAILLKCHQLEEGGVLSCRFPSEMSLYSQLIILNCFLSLGLINDARKILEYWYKVWSITGNVECENFSGTNKAKNPILIGAEVYSHIILSAFCYLEASGDSEFIKDILPMLRWANDAQYSCLARGTICFSTADYLFRLGFMPGRCERQGSAIATLKFIKSASIMADYLEELLLTGDIAQLEQQRRELDKTIRSYKSIFFDGNDIYCNSLKRRSNLGTSRFRYGVCDVCRVRESRPSLQWLERIQGDLYACPECYIFGCADIEPGDMVLRYRLTKASLMPIIINVRDSSGKSLFSNDELFYIYQKHRDKFCALGRVTSEISFDYTLPGDMAVMLNAMTIMRDSAAEKLLNCILNSRGKSIGWPEYYIRGNPGGSLSSTVESAMNVYAIMCYLKSLSGDTSIISL